MAITQDTFNGDGSNLGPFSFTFKWLRASDIKVSVGNVLKTVGTDYNLQGLNYATKSGGQVLFTAGNAPDNNAAIVINRQTYDADLTSTFYSGSAIRAQDLNDNFTQTLYKVQEVTNYSIQNVTNQTIDSVWTFLQSPVVPTPTQSGQAVSKSYVDTLAFNTTGIADGNKGDITISSQGNVWTLNESYLTTSAAAATYAPLSGLGSYLTTAAAVSTYAPLASPTFTGTVSGINASFSGTVIDGKGNLRSIPVNPQVSAYTLVLADAGKCISITTGGVTVPSGVFAAGDAITIFNNSTSNQSIVQGASVTLRQTGTANTGTRTLAQYGVATLLCVASNTFVISGGGLS
jgi:hypothetical protein